MNRKQESRIDVNCRVVMIVAKIRAPNVLMVQEMYKLAVVAAPDNARAWPRASGCFDIKAIAGTNWLPAIRDEKEKIAEQP